MVRPLEIAKHPDRLELDFCVSNGATFAAIGEYFDTDPRTVALYRRRMIEADPRYFDKLRVGGLPTGPELFPFAKIYASNLRRHWLSKAE